MNQLSATKALPLPEVLQASGSELDPKDAVDGVIIHIDGTDFGPGATLDVSWVVGDIHIKPARRPGNSTTFEYALTAREVALGIGQDAYISYDVKFADQTLFSPALHLRIAVLSNIPSPRVRYRRPVTRSTAQTGNGRTRSMDRISRARQTVWTYRNQYRRLLLPG